MADALDQLVESLLYEGYALYPYTPGATKNATPTPFGIVYPPAYAEGSTATFDHLELRCAARIAPDTRLAAEVRFLVAGAGHRAQERRIGLGAATVSRLLRCPLSREVEVPGGEGGTVDAAVALECHPLDQGQVEVRLRVENTTQCAAGLDRPQALARSLLSTHPVLRLSRGAFVSPLDRPLRSVNTFPVLATPRDDGVIGAAIVLPDHPQIAPESRGGLFDSTEIEEALLLHVRTLSEGELAEIEQADPAVRDMVARAAAATPEEIVALHGRVTIRDPVTTEPPPEPEGLADPSAGQAIAIVEGVTFRRGGRVVIRPGPDADLHARMLDGHPATIERIFTDYDGKTHLGVTVDDDPGQQLMRETGRFLFFFAPEVEVIE